MESNTATITRVDDEFDLDVSIVDAGLLAAGAASENCTSDNCGTTKASACVTC